MENVSVFEVMVISATFFAGFLAIAGIYGYKNWTEYKLRQKAFRQFQSELIVEQERWDNLPVLDKSHLLRGPAKKDNPSYARSFGCRYYNVIIFDEQGRCWFAIKNQQLIDDLIKCDYLLEDYWVPFCGPGEAFACKGVEVEGQVFDMYPECLAGKSPKSPEWLQWLAVAIHADRFPVVRNYVDSTNILWREEQRRQRRKFIGFISLTN